MADVSSARGPLPLYTPLPEDGKHLRILRLQPGRFEDPLKGDLIHDDLTSLTHNYRALSYVWGAPTEQCWIHVNERQYAIRVSLYEALQHIRSPTEALYLWADALCINQQDTEERNKQVAMMAQIYSTATEVLVWLGLADASFTYLSHINVFFDRLNGTNSKNIWYNSMTTHEDSLRDLCNRSYWSRAWTIQEFALAKSIILLCGKNQMSLPKFLERVAGCGLQMKSTYMRACTYFSNRQSSKGGKRQTLEDVLADVRQAECQDRRDRIFSVISLVDEFDGYESNLVDYTVSAEMMFLGLLAFCSAQEKRHPANLAAILQRTLQTGTVDLIILIKTIQAKLEWTDTSSIGEPGSTMELPLLEAEALWLVSEWIQYAKTEEDPTTDILTPILVKEIVPSDLILYTLESNLFGFLFQPTLVGAVYVGCVRGYGAEWREFNSHLELRHMLDDEYLEIHRAIRSTIRILQGSPGTVDLGKLDRYIKISPLMRYEYIALILGGVADRVKELCPVSFRFLAEEVFKTTFFGPEVGSEGQDLTFCQCFFDSLDRGFDLSEVVHTCATHSSNQKPTDSSYTGVESTAM